MTEEIPYEEQREPAVPAGATTTRKCSSCGEWYDARSASCYLCHEEEREYNATLKKAIETERLNSALAKQRSVVGREAAAERQIAAARQDRSGRAMSNLRLGNDVPGYGDLAGGIRDSLEEHPEVLDFFTQNNR